MESATASKAAHSVVACYSAAGSFTVSWRRRHTGRNNCRSRRDWNPTAARIRAQVEEGRGGMKRPLFRWQTAAGPSNGGVLQVGEGRLGAGRNALMKRRLLQKPHRNLSGEKRGHLCYRTASKPPTVSKIKTWIVFYIILLLETHAWPNYMTFLFKS